VQRVENCDPVVRGLVDIRAGEWNRCSFSMDPGTNHAPDHAMRIMRTMSAVVCGSRQRNKFEKIAIIDNYLVYFEQ
jgi:hypothetical protein